jgi:hypothetical protein
MYIDTTSILVLHFMYFVVITHRNLWLSNSTEHSPPRKANSHSSDKEIPRVFWQQNVHCRVHNSLPLVPILSQMRPVHTFPSYFTKMYSNTMLPPTTRSLQWSLPFTFPNHNSIRVSLFYHACYMPGRNV